MCEAGVLITMTTNIVNNYFERIIFYIVFISFVKCEKKQLNDEARMSNVQLPEIRSTEGFQARNWKQLSKKEIQKLDPVERSRYMAYESVSKQAAKDMCEARRRIHEKRKHDAKCTTERNPDREKHARLIGQLKAAEARNRIRLMRLRYTGNKASEMNNLIACQPSAIKAVRLQCLVPPRPEKIIIRDLLGKDERSRVDTLLEDELNLTTNRLLS